jgi:hypothetical protein
MLYSRATDNVRTALNGSGYKQDSRIVNLVSFNIPEVLLEKIYCKSNVEEKG